MKPRPVTIFAVTAILAASWSLQSALGQTDKTDRAVEQTYQAYVRAWKAKDIATLEQLISDQYMAVNFEGRVSDKQNELATAKSDADWISMNVDEIHTRVFGNAAIATGFISAHGKKPDGSSFNAKVRFLATLIKHGDRWQLVATQSASARPPQT
jgi:ketosteroid isomerase-like protein